jgi:hypothetical protein
MLGTFSGFRKVGIGSLQDRVLVAVAQLALHGGVAVLVFLFLLQGAFETVLVLALDMSHR